MALTRAELVRIAVRLLDEVGLQGLTLRRLAAEAGVSAATLYWHVKDKRDLLDLMAAAIVAEHPRATAPAPGQPWWEWLTESAQAQYHALIGHRDAALVVAGNRPTEDSLPVIDSVVGSLVSVGFPPAEALEAILTVGHFVIGSAVEYQAEAARAADPARDAAFTRRMQVAEDLPNLFAAGRTRRTPDPDRTFRYGLGLLVAGLRARHADLVAAPSG